MTTYEVIWRQTRVLQNKIDLFINGIYDCLCDDMKLQMQEIKMHASVLTCLASQVERTISLQYLYTTLCNEVSSIQSITWSLIKKCTDSALQQIGKHLYDACATFKKRLKARIQSITQQIDVVNANAFSDYQTPPVATGT